jgi:uncharacterized protein YjbI with pentapeptide repeats
MIIHKKSKNRLKNLKVDCSKCSGLCCTALFFSKIDGFPENKIAGKPCINLEKNYRCRIHENLEKRNMKGCIGYDCFGAGQHVTQSIYKGVTWQSEKEKSQEIFDIFVIVFQLYQIRYFLEESMTIILDKGLESNIESLICENENMCNYIPEDLLDIDMKKYKDKVNVVLKQVCDFIKKDIRHKNRKKPSKFFGKNYSKKDMSGFDFGMELLIAANFDSCRFDGTIFLGADTRDTNFNNADLREAVFLTQGQINCAKGNKNTKLPENLEYPVTWMHHE